MNRKLQHSVTALSATAAVFGLLLLAGGPALTERIELILRTFADRPHVFNLGHGIGQHTPIAHVEQLVATVRAWRG